MLFYLFNLFFYACQKYINSVIIRHLNGLFTSGSERYVFTEYIYSESRFPSFLKCLLYFSLIKCKILLNNVCFFIISNSSEINALLEILKSTCMVQSLIKSQKCLNTVSYVRFNYYYYFFKARNQCSFVVK